MGFDLFTAVIAVALGDQLTIWQVVGGLIVLAGVYLTTRPGATIPGPDRSGPAQSGSDAAAEAPARE